MIYMDSDGHGSGASSDTPRQGAVFPGSFDPITNGHLDLIVRAARVFSPLVVGVAVGGHGHTSKVPYLSLKQRVDLVSESIRSRSADLEGAMARGEIRVESFGGLLVDFIRTQNLYLVVRGIRSISDFEIESQMAAVNYDLDRNCETVFLVASRESSSISSTIVRQIAAAGGDLSPFVPPAVAQALQLAETV